MKMIRSRSALSIKVTFALLGSLWLGACAPNSSVTGGVTSFADGALNFGIFSDRSTKIERVLVILKLKTPPLYATAVLENNKPVIDQEQRKAIQAEQDAVVAELKEISEDIKVVFTYQMILNGIAIDLPYDLHKKVSGISQISGMSTAGWVTQPILLDDPPEENETLIPTNIDQRNSVKFIGADVVHKRMLKGQSGVEVPLDGSGVKIGIIDSGIDYTHKMFGGAGKLEAFKAINGDEPTTEFPTKRIVGGYDFAGSKFDPRSPNLELRFPRPDANPLAQGNHGTHVAGTIGGIGDGIMSYTGVAPGADLYALKVFGGGSASDSVILAAMEYAADPNKDGKADDRLDVLNLSLGHAFGAAEGSYAEAIRNLALGGVITVASAGNEGPVSYITGAPGSVTEAISVAASMDNSDLNIKFKTVAITSKTIGRLVLDRIQGPVSIPIEKLKVATEGPLVDVGFANEELSADDAARVKGKIAFITRGVKPFQVKVTNAVNAGAVGVLMVNNADGGAIVMGQQDESIKPYDIPAVMIEMKDGLRIQALLKKGEEVRIDFKAPDMLERLDNVDKMAGFSSFGPRVGDSRIKPEITAPGTQIISAASETGDKVMAMSGTSMAGPHVAGAMALMRQAYPKLSVQELKSLIMGRSVKLDVGVARQGAGRLQVDRAMSSPVVTLRSDISLGRVLLQSKKELYEKLVVKSLTGFADTYSLRLDSRHPGLKMKPVADFKLPAGGLVELSLDFTLDASRMAIDVELMDGWVEIMKGTEEVFRVPILAVARRVSPTTVESVKVMSSASDEEDGAGTEITLKNQGLYPTETLLFNFIGSDPRKPISDVAYANETCDLEAAGYRIVEKDVEGVKTQVLQVVAKIYNPMTTYNYCEVDVEIDADGDGEADQELAMISLKNVDGLSKPDTEQKFVSVLLDSKKMRKIRRAFEEKAREVPPEDDKKEEKEEKSADYKPAVLDMMPAEPRGHSTINIVEVRVDKLMRSKTGDLAVKISALQLDSSSDDSDDYLGPVETKTWTRLSLMPGAQSFQGLPESVELKAGESKMIRVKKGTGGTPLMALFPSNATTNSDVGSDRQMQLPENTYVFQTDK